MDAFFAAVEIRDNPRKQGSLLLLVTLGERSREAGSVVQPVVVDEAFGIPLSYEFQRAYRLWSPSILFLGTMKNILLLAEFVYF